jgi:exodeoxyribonuclease VII large subunit
VTPDGVVLRTSVRDLSNRLDSAASAAVEDLRSDVDSTVLWLARLSPINRVQNARQRVDDLITRLDVRLQIALERRTERLQAQRRALDAANPAALLRRGYALVTRSGDGQRVTSTRQAAEGTSLDITLQDGMLTATVRHRTTGAEEVG